MNYASTTMQAGLYDIKQGGQLVAHARITDRSYYITPVKLSGEALNAVIAGIDNGELPSGYTMKEKVQKQEAKKDKPDYGEMSIQRKRKEAWHRRKENKLQQI